MNKDEKTNELLTRLQKTTKQLTGCFSKKLSMDDYSSATYEFRLIKNEYQKMAAKSDPSDQNVFQLGQALRELESVINSPANPYNCI
ncbi:hypothetical protein [Methylobacter sp. BlB1]|uniref:hypothetical protein n=1 Tax=Methylobacter sp. BlB1 TaxID=2785914 RepID=UPI00189532BE|nr:hypothetical protein [Methylobacter sp. BlB1]MBF6647176.1 hypothetical protein [Methylobacter sp. BlB1]